MSYKMASKT